MNIQPPVKTSQTLETSKQKEYTFLQKLLNKANMGWWEADLKTESYVCSEFISRLLGIDEDGVISFEDFNKRILREDQHHTTSYSFDKLQQSIEEVYLLHTPHGEVWIRSKICFQETDEEGNTKIYGIAETHMVPTWLPPIRHCKTVNVSCTISIKTFPSALNCIIKTVICLT